MSTETLNTIDERLKQQSTDGHTAAYLSNAGGAMGGGFDATTNAAAPGGSPR